MTSVDGSLPAAAADEFAHGPASRWWNRAEDLLARFADRLNPILIKEARQALKSRQFTISFLLLLLLGWVWSILGLAMMGQAAYYSTGGPFMFYGYYLILAFPLIVIVPYSAFRSLATDREDRTYELLSITTLSARQVVSGKLAGAVLQMIVYMSAISPCLAFTYLLRGIDVPTMAFMVFYTFLYSLGLSLVGLLLASGSSEKWRQVVLSVVMVIGFVYAFSTAAIMGAGMLSMSQMPIDDWEFWTGNAAFLSGYASTFVLLLLAATAVLNFPSSNRSTSIRVAMFVQHVLFTGWMAWVWITEGYDHEILIVYMAFELAYWFGMGALMTGESDQLSPRVRRDLPQSFLGRALLTWFNPGPASGFVMSLGCFVSAIVIAMLALASHSTVVTPIRRFSMTDSERVLSFAILSLSYLIIYLGVGKLLVTSIRRIAAGGLLLSVLMQALLLVVGTVAPLIIQLSMPEYRNMRWSALQITNLFWTLSNLAFSGTMSDVAMLLVVLPIAAGIVFLLNLPSIAAEVRNVRVARPVRVAEEDAALALQAAPIEPVHTSPWD